MLGAGIVVCSLLWILVLSLLSLALSAWVKWRVVAGALLLAVFFMGAGFAQAINAVLDTKQGYVLDISTLIATVEHWMFRDGALLLLPVTESLIVLLLFAGCCLLLLMLKVKPNEVVQ